MIEYRILLALLYFEEHKDDYSISSLMHKLGLTLRQTDLLIDTMINHKLLQYKDYFLMITEKGERIVVENNMQNYKVSDNYINDKILPDKALALDDIYVPNDFSKKYKI